MVIINMASPADKSVCLTKYLTKFPKFSTLDIANYLQTYGKKKTENKGYESYYSSITASDFSAHLFVSKYKKSFSLKCLEHTFVYFVTLKSSLSGVDARRLPENKFEIFNTCYLTHKLLYRALRESNYCLLIAFKGETANVMSFKVPRY